jgi:hypothetical protein
MKYQSIEEQGEIAKKLGLASKNRRCPQRSGVDAESVTPSVLRDCRSLRGGTSLPALGTFKFFSSNRGWDRGYIQPSASNRLYEHRFGELLADTGSALWKRRLVAGARSMSSLPSFRSSGRRASWIKADRNLGGMVDGLRPRDRAAQHRVLGRLITGDVRCWSVNGLYADVGFSAESDPFQTCASRASAPA